MMLTKEKIDDAIAALKAKPHPKTYVSTFNKGLLDVYTKWKGGDWRRLKREFRKYGEQHKRGS